MAPVLEKASAETCWQGGNSFSVPEQTLQEQLRVCWGTPLME